MRHLGAGDDLEYLVGRLREDFPDVRIVLRADSGFGVPGMYAACERLEIDYTIGIGMNATLKKLSDALLATRGRAVRSQPASRNGCSARFGIKPARGQPSVGSSSSAKPTPKARIAEPW